MACKIIFEAAGVWGYEISRGIEEIASFPGVN